MTSSDDDIEHLLRTKDVVFQPWGCTLTVNSSKTIQFNERSLVLPVSWSAKPLCAASFVKDYLERYPRHDSEFLFTLPSSSHQKPVSYNLALCLLKSWCKKAGLTKDVGFHSLRRGAASYMNKLHINLISIQRAGDWKSLCILKYLSVGFEQRRDVERKVSSSL